MFTGLVEAIGRIRSMESCSAGLRLQIDAGELDLADVAIGDSVAVNGCCLTVVALGGGVLSMDISNETLACTTFAALSVDCRVNLERALRVSGRLGGHLLTGHIDGVAQVLERLGGDEAVELSFRVPGELARYICRKGSVAIDGISLTVNRVSGVEFSIQLIPHTLKATVAGSYEPGMRVNIEVDLIARYVESLLLASATHD